MARPVGVIPSQVAWPRKKAAANATRSLTFGDATTKVYNARNSSIFQAACLKIRQVVRAA
jgi:hypothetical protein